MVKGMDVRKVIALMLLLFINSAIGLAYAEELPDFLLLKSSPDLRPLGDAIRADEPFVGEIYFEKTKEIALPTNATLYISTEVINPRILVKIDSKTSTYSVKNVSIPLDPKKFEEIYVKIEGYAPATPKQIKMTAFNISTFVFYDYKALQEMQQETIKIYSVSTPEVERLVKDIENAKERLDTLNRKIIDLRGATSTTTLELKSDDIRNLLKIAEDYHESARIEEAKLQMDKAQKNLQALENEVAGIEKQQRLKKYGMAGAVILIILVGVYLIRKQREELG